MPLIITPEDKRRIAVYLVAVGCVCDFLSLWKTCFLLMRVRRASLRGYPVFEPRETSPQTTLLYRLVRCCNHHQGSMARRHGYHPGVVVTMHL